MAYEAKHTPGPWRAREMVRHGQLYGYFVAADDVNGFAYDAEILGEDEYRDGMDRWAADAHLISAAPELLTALRLLHAHLFGPDPLLSRVDIDSECRAAIAKAEGRAA